METGNYYVILSDIMKLKKIFVILFLIAGFIISGFGILDIHTAMQCKRWTPVKGRIMGSTIVEMPGASKMQNSEIYVPDIAYEYSYENKTYFNQAIAYLPDALITLQNTYYSGSEDEILDLVKKYPINSEVDVFVNPDNPELAVLDTSLKLPLFTTLILGVLFIYLALHISIFGDRYILSKGGEHKKSFSSSRT